ncbi:hypothetical protein MHSWG343_01250 [Candidatus Mycoplasma haematohominis]|uniref:Uncharacterized protein n=1 Tax=Candidatus Mycoplasma haematohominis TaxID=1494318 RepID=A0A478FQ04_9MOLU|nr:hypothetical protein MHSWG343_01250 [Candidatus Mycoplasma haemohominis]
MDLTSNSVDSFSSGSLSEPESKSAKVGSWNESTTVSVLS